MKGGFILTTLYIIYTPQNLIKQAKNLSYPQPLYIVYIKLTNTIYSMYKNNLIKIYKVNYFYNIELFFLNIGDFFSLSVGVDTSKAQHTYI